MRIITKFINWLKYHIRNFLGCTQAETNGLLMLGFIVFLVLLLPPASQYYYSQNYGNQKVNEDSLDSLLLDSLLTHLALHMGQSPDKLDKMQQNASLDKRLSIAKRPANELTTKHNPSVVITPFDINKATSLNLEKIPGITTKRANTILKYRNQLGGFIDKKQFREIYGLDKCAVESMEKYTYIENHFTPYRLLNINQANFKELLAHPYLNFQQVKKIIDIRTKQGVFTDLGTLVTIGIITEDTFKKLWPYLTL